MVQFAVTTKDGEWTLFRDACILAQGLTRSAAIEMAKSLAFEAEERGETVETLIQGYAGEVVAKRTGALPD